MRIRVALAAAVIAATGLTGTGTATALTPTTPTPTVGTPPSGCTVENGCRLIVNPAFPGSPGTAAIPQKRADRPFTLDEILGNLTDNKWPIVQWRSRYTDVWKHRPAYIGFQSGAFDNHGKAVSVYGQCGTKDSQKNGGDWTDPTVWIGSGGNRMQKPKEIQIDLRNGFKCDGKLRLLVPPSYWRQIDCGKNEINRACYFDILFPSGETDMLVQADDDTWLTGLAR